MLKYETNLSDIFQAYVCKREKYLKDYTPTLACQQ